MTVGERSGWAVCHVAGLIPAAILTAVPEPNRLGLGVSVHLESRAPSEQHTHVRQDGVAELGHQCGASRQGSGRRIAPGADAVRQLHIR